MAPTIVPSDLSLWSQHALDHGVWYCRGSMSKDPKFVFNTLKNFAPEGPLGSVSGVVAVEGAEECACKERERGVAQCTL